MMSEAKRLCHIFDNLDNRCSPSSRLHVHLHSTIGCCCCCWLALSQAASRSRLPGANGAGHSLPGPLLCLAHAPAAVWRHICEDQGAGGLRPEEARERCVVVKPESCRGQEGCGLACQTS